MDIKLNLPLLVTSEDGRHYAVEPFFADLENVGRLANELLSRDLLWHSKGDFKQLLLSRYTVILDVGCGHFVAHTIRSLVDAEVVFVFYDGVMAGRQKLVLSVFDWLMRTFSLNRITLCLPVFAHASIYRYKRMGLKLEGVKREAMFNGLSWSDVVVFGVTRKELTLEALALGHMDLSAEERKAYAQLKHRRGADE